MQDSISHLIIQLKNGSAAKKETVAMPHSNFTESVALALARKGFVKPAQKKGKGIQKTLEVGLIYVNGHARINDVKRISKPSKRLYKGYSEIHQVKQGFGSTFVSTPKGILSDDEARKEKVGGEVLFQIW
ncbi:MAG: ribosomal protein [Candidatus Parcubacteria bacterium]|jgi:small subunit ribosomal protein S8